MKKRRKTNELEKISIQYSTKFDTIYNSGYNWLGVRLWRRLYKIGGIIMFIYENDIDYCKAKNKLQKEKFRQWLLDNDLCIEFMLKGCE